jgi:hypothetical protein
MQSRPATGATARSFKLDSRSGALGPDFFDDSRASGWLGFNVTPAAELLGFSCALLNYPPNLAALKILNLACKTLVKNTRFNSKSRLLGAFHELGVPDAALEGKGRSSTRDLDTVILELL